MWCIGQITAEYRARMYDLLELYAKPYDAAEPVICLDEKSKQLLEQTRRPIPAIPGRVAKEDYEYKWNPRPVIGKSRSPGGAPNRISWPLCNIWRRRCTRPRAKSIWSWIT